MTCPDDGCASADGPEPGFAVPGSEEPSTRRVTLGSPAAASPPGEPYFSEPIDPADAVFAALKERISRLWDENASPADIQSVLGEVRNRQE